MLLCLLVCLTLLASFFLPSHLSLKHVLSYAELRDHNIKIPAEMVQSLMVLHSYLLVKVNCMYMYIHCTCTYMYTHTFTMFVFVFEIYNIICQLVVHQPKLHQNNIALCIHAQNMTASCVCPCICSSKIHTCTSTYIYIYFSLSSFFL